MIVPTLRAILGGVAIPVLGGSAGVDTGGPIFFYEMDFTNPDNSLYLPLISSFVG